MLFAVGPSLITPLIPIYKSRLGFGDAVVTLFLVCYAATLVPSMLTLSQLSDRVGRKSLLIGALGIIASLPETITTRSRRPLAVTGGACGLVFKGEVDLATRIAPPDDRGRLISSYYVACYPGGFSPLLIVGGSADLIGLGAALTLLTAVAAAASAWTVGIGLRVVAELPSAEAILGE